MTKMDNRCVPVWVNYLGLLFILNLILSVLSSNISNINDKINNKYSILQNKESFFLNLILIQDKIQTLVSIASPKALEILNNIDSIDFAFVNNNKSSIIQQEIRPMSFDDWLKTSYKFDGFLEKVKKERVQIAEEIIKLREENNRYSLKVLIYSMFLIPFNLFFGIKMEKEYSLFIINRKKKESATASVGSGE
jgi:hypothetical protein